MTRIRTLATMFAALIATALTLSGCSLVGTVAGVLPALPGVPGSTEPPPSSEPSNEPSPAISVRPTVLVPTPSTVQTSPTVSRPPIVPTLPNGPTPASTQPQQPSTTRPQLPSTTNYYGSIAVNRRTGSYGYAYNYATKAKAEAAAVKYCKRYRSPSSCKTAMWVRNACAALAFKYYSGGGWRWGADWATTKAAAAAKAKKLAGSGAKVKASFCTAGR